IMRHLVDATDSFTSISLEPSQMGLGQGSRRHRIERCDAFGVWLATVQPLRQSAHRLAQKFEFAVSMNLGMAREDLLDQACARAHHPDYKDRPLGAAADPFLGSEDLLAKGRDYSIDKSRVFGSLVGVLDSAKVVDC